MDINKNMFEFFFQWSNKILPSNPHFGTLPTHTQILDSNKKKVWILNDILCKFLDDAGIPLLDNTFMTSNPQI